MFAQWTGIIIDPYQRLVLSIENQKTLIQVIDKYIEATDLNTNKKKTSAIFEFKGLLYYFSSRKTDIRLIGD